MRTCQIRLRFTFAACYSVSSLVKEKLWYRLTFLLNTFCAATTGQNVEPRTDNRTPAQKLFDHVHVVKPYVTVWRAFPKVGAL